MKTVEEAKFEYLDTADLNCDIIEQNMNAFDAGFKFAQKLISVNEEKPKFEGKEINQKQFILSKDDEIGMYEKFLDEFTDKEGRLVKCNPDAIFNWFAWKLWR